MKESDFYKRINKGLNGIKLWRVENRVNAGMPDIFFILEKGICGWIELKVSRDYLTSSPKLRPAQLAWMKDYASYNGIVIVITYSSKSIRVHQFIPQPKKTRRKEFIFLFEWEVDGWDFDMAAFWHQIKRSLVV